MKKIFIILMSILIISSASPVLAADGQVKLPTRLTYTKEWLNYNLFTWKAQSKVNLADQYATNRANEIKTIVDQNNSSELANLISRYSGLIAKTSQIIQKNKNNSSSLISIVKSDLLLQQKILSEARQSALIESDQKTIASAQESAVNKIKQNITDIENSEAATSFADQIVSAWRDPNQDTKNNETATRVYAAGTSLQTEDINNGILIDGGQAKIIDENNQLKIEYAPGTGPSSLTADNGKKLWKIQMSDGTVIDSYTAGGNVVIGKNSGTASNIVVNTVSGGTSSTANIMTGNSSGTSGVTVVGGKSVVKTGQAGMESGGPAADPSQTIINSTNSTNSANSLNQTSGDGQGVGQVEPATQQ